jgi:hypothetical protein
MRAFTSRALLAFTLAGSLQGAAAFAAKPAEPAASQPADAVSQAFAGPFNATQDMLKAGNGQAALAKLKELEALPGLTPYEQYLIVHQRAQAEYMVNDTNGAVTDFEAVLASPQLPAGDRLTIMKVIATLLYSSEQYPKAAVALQRYVDAGGEDAQLKELLPQAQYASKDYATAAKGFKAEVDAIYAGGHVPSEKLLRLLATSYSQSGNDTGYVSTLELLAVAYPKPEYWSGLVARVPHTEKFSDRLYIDNYRMKAQIMGSVADSERLIYAALTSRAGYPEEAKHILDDAYANKPFTGVDLTEANKLRAEVNKSVASDRLQAAANLASARGAKDGNALFSMGLVEVVDGNAAQGLELMQQGLAKGGLRAPEEARLHLGYAQVKAGHDAEALKTFQSITSGPVGIVPMAHVWVLYLQSRLQPAAPAPAAAASK